jgi:hypothetical protein
MPATTTNRLRAALTLALITLSCAATAPHRRWIANN